MKGAFGLLGLVLVLAVVGVLVRKQLVVSRPPLPAVAPSAAGAPAAPVPALTVREHSQQTQQAVRQATEGLMQQARPMPDDQ
jgi:hypothetical protein